MLGLRRHGKSKHFISFWLRNGPRTGPELVWELDSWLLFCEGSKPAYKSDDNCAVMLICCIGNVDMRYQAKNGRRYAPRSTMCTLNFCALHLLFDASFFVASFFVASFFVASFFVALIKVTLSCIDCVLMIWSHPVWVCWVKISKSCLLYLHD